MHMGADGIVLKLQKIDHDRKLTVLTQSQGVITAYANGANKMRSALASSTELLTYSSFVLFENRGRYTVDRADVNRIFLGIRTDIEKLALASFFAEISAELCPYGEPADAYLSLLLNTLHMLDGDARPPLMLKAVFTLRALTIAGFMPNLVACRDCGAYEHPEMRFFPVTGELLCGDCADDERGCHPVAAGIQVSASVLAAMRHTIYCDAKKLFAFSIAEESIALLDYIAQSYLGCQIDKRFATLEFYENIKVQGALYNQPT